MEKSIEFPSNRIDVIIGEKMRLNIMVVGESGQGKTTYLHTLLRRYVDSVYLVDPHTLLKKTIQIIEVGKFSITDISERTYLHIYLYDSPGYGDYINNQSHIDAIYENIIARHNQRNSLDFPLLSDKERNESDTRIHCVFYFIASHRMKDIDIEFIEKLCPIVPLVPIVAKADMMTVNERNQHVKAVYDRLQDLSAKLHRSCVFEFAAGDYVGMTEENVQAVVSDTIEDQNATTAAGSSASVCHVVETDADSRATTECEGKNVKNESRVVNVIENENSTGISHSSSSSVSDHIRTQSNTMDTQHDQIPLAAEKEDIESPTPAIMTESRLADTTPPNDSFSSLSSGMDISNHGKPVSSTNHSHSPSILKEAYYYENRHNNQQQTYQPLMIARNVNSAIEHYPNIFAVVCDLSNERVYPWGKLEIYDMNHSDFRKLQMLLFEDGQNIKRLIDTTNEMSKMLYMKASGKVPASPTTSELDSVNENGVVLNNNNNNIQSNNDTAIMDSIHSASARTTTTSDHSINTNDDIKSLKRVSSKISNNATAAVTTNNETDRNTLPNVILIYLLNILLSCVIMYYIINIYMLNFT